MKNAYLKRRALERDHARTEAAASVARPRTIEERAKSMARFNLCYWGIHKRTVHASRDVPGLAAKVEAFQLKALWRNPRHSFTVEDYLEAGLIPPACPLGLCDGSGVVVETQFDNSVERKCPHTNDV